MKGFSGSYKIVYSSSMSCFKSGHLINNTSFLLFYRLYTLRHSRLREGPLIER